MELAIFFYAADVVDKLQVLSAVLAAILTFALAVGAIISSIGGLWNKFLPGFKVATLIASAAWLVFTATPSKDTMYTMAAAYGVQAAAENTNVQRLAGKSLKLLEDKLDDYLKPEDAGKK